MNKTEDMSRESVNKGAGTLALLAVIAVQIAYRRDAEFARISVAAVGASLYLASVILFGRGYGSTHLKTLLNLSRGVAIIVALFLLDAQRKSAWVPWVALALSAVLVCYGVVTIMVTKPKALFIYAYLIGAPLLFVDPSRFSQ